MVRRRRFTPEFKAQVVLELLTGTKTSAELCREHQIAPSVLADWKAIFLAQAATVFQTPEPRSTQEASRIAELEGLVGRMTLEAEILKKATSILHARAKTSVR